MKSTWFSPMKSVCNTGLVLSAIAVVALLCPIALSGQVAYTPNVNNVGLPANGVFSGGSIDSVQLQNGNLHVDIPLLHLPGIGMDTDIHFVYDNQLFNMTTVNYGNTQLTMTWEQISMGRNGFAQVSDPLQGVLKAGTHQESWNCSVAHEYRSGGPYTHIDYMAFTDSNGTGHSFPIYGYESYYYDPENNPNCKPADDYPANSYSGDATGYNLNISTADGHVVSLTDKHGTQYTLGSGVTSGDVGATVVSLQPPNPGLVFTNTPTSIGPTELNYQQVIKVEDSDGNTISRGTQCQSGTYCFIDTVGRTIVEAGGPGGLNIPYMAGEANVNEPGTISYLDQNGTTQTITINYSPYALDLPSLPCNPVVCGVLIETPVSAVVVNLPTSIILQNGDTYTIQYKTDGDAGCNPGTTLGCTLGEISSITLPTGGIISYTWSGLVGHPGKIYGREVLSRTVTANGQSSTWRFTGGTVTDPNMNDTVYTFDWTGGAASANSDCRGPVGSAVVTQEVSYNGPQSANNPIDTRNITYAFYGSSMGYGTYLPTSNVLTWISSGATTETDTTYDNPVPLSAGCPSEGSNVTSRGNVVSKKVYDYGSGAHGALLSNTQYSYWHNQYSAYAAANIADRVSQVSVYDAGNSLVAQTTTNYDGFSQSAQSGLAAPGWTTTHDSGYSSAYTLRGLPTSVTKCSGPSSSPCSASITTYADYNTLGQPTVSTDGRGYSTTNTYSQQSNTFVATTTLPLTGNGITHATTKYTDVNTGLLMEQTDFNNNSTSYTYERLMRPHSIQRPDGGSTRYSYPDPNQVVSVVKEDSSGRKQATTTDLDGLGRTVSVSSTSDAACGLLIVDTKYDLLGRKIAISNPHCLSAQATDGWSRYTYDAIGRLTSKQNPDGTAQHWSFNGNVVNSYDEKQNLWTRTYNAESWLTQVLEPSGGASSTLETDYGYDTLGNLQQVDQWGGAYGSSNDHVRQFSYDAISRLIQGYNPESGWTCYGTTGGAAPDGSNCSSGYDGNGNLLYKTDARGITISYSYDAMNRLLGKTYSDGTPPVALTYDTPGANAIGQLTEAQAGSGSMMAQSLMTSYDPMGRLVSEQQCTPANCPGNTSEAQTRYSLGYQYDFTGFVTQSTNSAGMYSSAAPGYQSLTLTNTPDVAERLTQITSNWSDAYHPSVLFRASSGSGNPGYGPMGLLNATLGVNSLTGTTTGTLVRNYDNRGRTVFEADSGQGPIATTDSTGSITINGAEQQLIETNMGGIASFSIGGQEYTHNGACLDPESNQYTSWCGGQYQQVPDIGWVAVTITTPSGSYTASGGWSVSTDTPTTVASSLASSFNSLGSPAGSLFTATANGNVVTVQALATGPSSDYSYTISNPACYPVGAIGCSDFWAGGSNPKGAFINGTTAGTYYDQGTVTATISGTPVSVNYGACSTASSIASSLASAINSTAGGFVSAIASGQTVSLTSAQGGPSTDWSLSTSVTWDQSDLCRISTCPPGYCQPASCAPSYTVSVDGGASSSGSMTGGSDSSNGVVYSFMIPDQGGFDPVGNLLSVQDSVMGNWSYSYDNLNRLIGGSAASGAYSASPPSSWSYDPFGNRTSGVTPVSSAYASYALPNNQITGGLVQYDAAGNVII
jgi:YD repeat-containing protein